MTHEQIAEIAHEANRIYCESLGDHTQPHWELAPKNIKDSAIDGVKAVADGRVVKPGDSHRNWLEFKEKDGWKFGERKDAVRKLHPCFVPFDELPPEQQIKDYLFVGIVKTLLHLPEDAIKAAKA